MEGTALIALPADGEILIPAAIYKYLALLMMGDMRNICLPPLQLLR